VAIHVSLPSKLSLSMLLIWVLWCWLPEPAQNKWTTAKNKDKTGSMHIHGSSFGPKQGWTCWVGISPGWLHNTENSSKSGFQIAS
jgi:hypothetical protein